jgi:hypothetical protein
MSTAPLDRLLGIRAKIKRAKEHIRDLQTRIDELINPDSYAIIVEDDPKTGDKVYRAQFRSPIPPELPAIIGDVLHNLRSALDHLVWQLVKAAGNKPSRENSFPIFTKAKDFRDLLKKFKAGGNCKIKGVTKAAMQLIKRTKPYKRGNRWLWVIHELNNIDKHRLLIAAAAANPYLALEREGKRESVWQRPKIQLLKDGAEVFRWPRSIAKDMDMQTQFAILIAFGEPKVIKGQPVVPLLQQLADLVDAIVSQFVSFL